MIFFYPCCFLIIRFINKHEVDSLLLSYYVFILRCSNLFCFRNLIFILFVTMIWGSSLCFSIDRMSILITVTIRNERGNSDTYSCHEQLTLSAKTNNIELSFICLYVHWRLYEKSLSVMIILLQGKGSKVTKGRF